jgi:hypothetical protein
MLAPVAETGNQQRAQASRRQQSPRWPRGVGFEAGYHPDPLDELIEIYIGRFLGHKSPLNLILSRMIQTPMILGLLAEVNRSTSSAR